MQSPIKRALRGILQLKAQVKSLERGEQVPIAIVGMSCRLPGAPDLDALWSLLTEGREGVTEVPRDRWDVESLYHPDPARTGRILSRRGGFVDNLDRFDAAFFGISSREAPHVDPRQRLILELAWEALEDAGIPPGSLAGSQTASIISVLTSDYEVVSRDGDHQIQMYTGTGMANTIVSNRLAYVFDLHGPSLTLDTACSGSLVGLHLACRDLHDGTATLALVGGVEVNLLPLGDMLFSRANALSPDGLCKTFDDRANGIVRSEGAGLVVLKRLDQAVADGDRVYAVIRGTAVNQDGRSNGMMAPNGRAQKAVLEAAYARAGIEPSSVQYVEAHGTGTPLGDPIEVTALNEVLGPGRGEGEACRLGSVKTNIGHTEPAAGVAGVIKTALCIHHRELVPSLHFETPNHRIPFDRIPFKVQTERGPWPRPDAPLRAGVSGFGFGGTNAHVVLEEPPAGVEADAGAVGDEGCYVLPVSARSPGALRTLVTRYRDRLATLSGPEALRALVRGASTAREGLRERAAFTGQSPEALIEGIDAWLRSEPAPRHRGPGPVVFVYSGQGGFWRGMARELYEAEPVFRQAFDEAADALVAWGADPLQAEVFRGEDPDAPADALVAQRATFALQVGLTALWRRSGITPDAVVGHSLGEAAAAFASGALSLEDAAAVVYHRSRLMKAVEGQGATAVVGLPPADLVMRLPAFGGDLAVAGNNSPGTTVVSGGPEAVDALIDALTQEGTFARRIQGVRTAFHGPQMDPVQDALEDALMDLSPEPCAIEMYSTVDAEVVDGTMLDGAYWGRNVREPFRFAEVVDALLSEGAPLFIEVAPHRLLGPAIQQTARERGLKAETLTTMERGADARESFSAAIAEAFTLGLDPSWEAICPAGPRSLDLPHYPWQRQHYWLEQIPPHSPPLVNRGEAPEREAADHPLLGHGVEVIGGTSALWRSHLSSAAPSWLGDHKALGRVLFPGAAFAEMALAAAGPAGEAATIGSLTFVEAMPLDAAGRPVQLQLDRTSGGRGGVAIFSKASKEGEWRLHARAEIGAAAPTAPAPEAPESVRGRCEEAVDAAAHYAHMAGLGLDYGAAFQTVREVFLGEGEVLGRVALDPGTPVDRYRLHPALLDGCFQLAAHLGAEGEARLPEGVDRLALVGAQAREVLCHLRAREEEGGLMKVDLTLMTPGGALVAQVEGLGLRAIADARSAEKPPSALIHTLSWIPEAAGEGDDDAIHGRWLVVGDGALARRLAGELEVRGAHDTWIAGPEELGDDGALRALLAGLTTTGAPAWRGVIVATGDEKGAVGRDALSAVQTTCQRVIDLLQGIAGLEQGGDPPRLWILTQGVPMGEGAQERAGGGLPGAALWGIGRVLALEMPSLWGGIVDTGALDDEAAAEALLGEIASGQTGQQCIFRGGERRVPRLRRATLEGTSPLIPPRGAVLITGGLAGVGLEIARDLARAGARRLLLIGRTPLPPRRAWRDLPTEHPASGRVRAVLELEALGATVHPLAVDVSDARALTEAVEGYEALGYPPIRGIVHAAGVLRDAMLVRLAEGDLSAVMAPKLGGALTLATLSEGRELDFFALFSSLTSVIGRVGQTAYAAANAALDALAHGLRARGVPACAMNWGPWGEVGMFTRLSAGQAQSLAHPMSTAQGVATFGRAIGAGLAQPIIVDFGQTPKAPLFSELPTTLTAHEADGAVEAGGGEPLLELFMLDASERMAAVAAKIDACVSQIFHASPGTLNARASLANQGLDSLMAVEIAGDIRRSYGVQLPIQDIFLLSVGSLSERVLDQVVLDESVIEALLAEVEDTEEPAAL